MKTIIFDFDGTLADTFPITIEILSKIGRYYGLPKIEESDYPAYKKIGVLGLMKKFRMPKIKLIVFALHVKYLMKKELDSIKVFDGVKELLERLVEDGFRVLIFSSNNKKNIAKVLQNNGIENSPKVYTEISLVNKEVGLRKVLVSENLKAEDVVYVGDEVRDFTGARGAGIRFIGVSWGFNSREGLEEAGAEEVVESMDELLAKIKQPF